MRKKAKSVMETKRIDWIDTVKFICIIFVILSHLETCTNFWTAFYTPFFLMAFFFVSGYVYKPIVRFSELLYKKYRQLFIPWLVFSVLNLLLSQVLSFNVHGHLLNELMWNFFQIRGQGDGVWFVACLFVAYIPFYFFVKLYEKLNGGGYSKSVIAILIAFILSLFSVLYTKMMPPDILPWGTVSLPWHLEYIFQAMFYMVLGYIFRKQFERIFDSINSTKCIVLFVSFIYLIIVFMPYTLKVHMPTAINIGYLYISQLLGIITVVAFAKKIKSNAYIRYVGQNTLICFALHGKVYSVLQTVMRKVIPQTYEAILKNEIISSIVALVLALLISVILIIPSYIINNQFPYIIGRKGKHLHR